MYPSKIYRCLVTHCLTRHAPANRAAPPDKTNRLSSRAILEKSTLHSTGALASARDPWLGLPNTVNAGLQFLEEERKMMAKWTTQHRPGGTIDTDKQLCRASTVLMRLRTRCKSSPSFGNRALRAAKRTRAGLGCRLDGCGYPGVSGCLDAPNSRTLVNTVSTFGARPYIEGFARAQLAVATRRAKLTWLAVHQIFDRGADRATRLGKLLAVERVLAGAAGDVHCNTEAKR